MTETSSTYNSLLDQKLMLPEIMDLFQLIIGIKLFLQVRINSKPFNNIYTHRLWNPAILKQDLAVQNRLGLKSSNT